MNFTKFGLVACHVSKNNRFVRYNFFFVIFFRYLLIRNGYSVMAAVNKHRVDCRENIKYTTFNLKIKLDAVNFKLAKNMR